MKDKLTFRHKKLLFREPTPEQMTLYEAAPKKRGFASARFLTPQQEADLFEAVFLYALSQTSVDDPNQEPKTVYLFLDPSLESWATGQIQRVVGAIFAICKQQKAGAKAQHLGKLIKSVLVGTRLPTSTASAPDHWAVFGVEPNPKLPAWLNDALIPVYPTDRDG